MTLASEALREAHVDLAHVDRITTMGRLTASVAHEVKQPIATIVTNAQAARHFLDHRPPDLEEVRQALDCIVKDAYRAGDVINRICGLFKKAPLKKERVEINGAIRDVLELTRGAATKNGVSVLTRFAEPSPAVQADRVQLQQVILNLIINAVEAMSSMREGARELLICTDKAESNGALVAVRDSGPGLAPETLEHVFEASYTTKASGLGLGLWICRSIVEAHGGRLWATANGACGGLFQFILPNAEKELMNAPQAGYQTEEPHECTAINASYQLTLFTHPWPIVWARNRTARRSYRLPREWTVASSPWRPLRRPRTDTAGLSNRPPRCLNSGEEPLARGEADRHDE